MSGAQNPVDIDPAALAAEADSVSVPDAPDSSSAAQSGQDAPDAGELGSDTAATGEQSLEQAMAQAGPLAIKLRPVVQRMAERLVPAWKLTGEECGLLADDVALVITLWAPSMNALPPKWMALASLGMTVYAIADARRDTDGNLLPRAVVSAGRGSASAPAAESQGARTSSEGHATGSGGGFKTSA